MLSQLDCTQVLFREYIAQPTWLNVKLHLNISFSHQILLKTLWHRLSEKHVLKLRFWFYVTFVIHMYKTSLCTILQHTAPRIDGTE
jgi:hypothetical protein